MTTPQVPHDDLWKRTHRATLATRTAVIAERLLLVVVLWAVLSTLYAVRSTQQTNAPKVDNTLRAAQNSTAILKYIQDCQTPGTDCFKRNQAGTADVLERVVDIVLYANICTHGHLTERGLMAAHVCIATLEKAHADVNNP